MASYDALDFLSSSPAPPPPDSDPLFDSYIDSNAYLDHSFCSNFSCCGQSLPDLHHLLDHFEEDHVLPFPPHDSRPTFSSPVYARPAGPHASYILSYPQPDPPLHPLSLLLSSAHGPLRPVPDSNQIPDLVHSPSSLPSSSASSSCLSSPTLGEPLCLPPALFSCQPPPTPSPQRRRTALERKSDSSYNSDISSNPVRPLVGPQRNAKSHARPDPLARNRPLALTPQRAPPQSASRKRDGREKMYKCPHAGCTKSYLNPNGLKYHLEKGTCTNVDARVHPHSHSRGHLEFPEGTGTEADAASPTSVSESSTPEPHSSVSPGVDSAASSEAEDDAFDDGT
ncbi:hypothetical protein C8Q79DRAFT_520469 [Trametes meyenii]|nr:hypothetical protein C8Q79DRAFT_520469 [Trametes meyenii]